MARAKADSTLTAELFTPRIYKPNQGRVVRRLVNWPVFANFLVSVEAELDKVTWADWTYLKRATAVVIVTMFVLGIYLFLCDVVWQQLFGFVGFLDLEALGD